MKKAITSILCVLTLSLSALAQEPQEKQKLLTGLTLTSKIAGDTIIKGEKEKIYIGKGGGKYVIVTAKDGHYYKKYITKKAKK